MILIQEIPDQGELPLYGTLATFHAPIKELMHPSSDTERGLTLEGFLRKEFPEHTEGFRYVGGDIDQGQTNFSLYYPEIRFLAASFFQTLDGDFYKATNVTQTKPADARNIFGGTYLVPIRPLREGELYGGYHQEGPSKMYDDFVVWSINHFLGQRIKLNRSDDGNMKRVDPSSEEDIKRTLLGTQFGPVAPVRNVSEAYERAKEFRSFLEVLTKYQSR